MSEPAPLGLWEAWGIELEYMVVDRETLAVRPIVDELLAEFSADGTPGDVERGPIAWSNELSAHVVELKTNGPRASLAGCAADFLVDLRAIDAALAKHGAMLLPGAMHPTMDPRTELTLWPHEYGEVYRTYDRIFDCRRHGWANLQSQHVNLPFADDQEFERLHAAVRAVLPLLPALAASSPVMDGKVTSVLDNRMHVYCTHQARIPEAMGLVVPEVLRSRDEYDAKIFAPLREAARKLDPEGILQPEFLNARGAIARFQRMALEIRVLDIQETPRADLAIALFTTAIVRALAEERWAPLASLHALPTEGLAKVLSHVIRDGAEVVLDDRALLAVFGRNAPAPVGEILRGLRDDLRGGDAAWAELGPTVDQLLAKGSLAARLDARLEGAGGESEVQPVWRELAASLTTDRLFGVG